MGCNEKEVRGCSPKAKAVTKCASVSETSMFRTKYGVGMMVSVGRRRDLYSKG